MNLMYVEMGDLFSWIYNTFLGYGFQFLYKIGFYWHGFYFSMLDLIIGTLVFALAFFLIKNLLGYKLFFDRLDESNAGKTHIKDRQSRKNYNDTMKQAKDVGAVK